MALHFNIYAGILIDDGNGIIEFTVILGFDAAFVVVEFNINNPAAELVNVSAFWGVQAFILAVVDTVGIIIQCRAIGNRWRGAF